MSKLSFAVLIDQLTLVQNFNAYPMDHVEKMEVLLILRGYLDTSGEADSTPLISQHWKRAVKTDMHSIGWCTQPMSDRHRMYQLVYTRRKGSLFADCVHPLCDPMHIHEGMMEDD